MKILFVAAEISPLVKVGGLADVTGSLPAELRKAGHDVRVFIPQYGCIDTRRYGLANVSPEYEILFAGENQTAVLNQTTSDGLPIYILENRKYFGGSEVYTSNDLDRFGFFCRAVHRILPTLDWQPEVVHCHDWHTSLLPMWIRRSEYPYASVFTIHNLAFQGQFDSNYLDARGLNNDWEGAITGSYCPPLNFMSQALLWSDAITTVSPTYAREIITPEQGMGLDGLLRYRQDSLSGILNGLDYNNWNPETDSYLPVNFSSAAFAKRALNKIALQRVAGLPVNGEVPLIGMVQRLDGQKGLDLVGQAMEAVLQETGCQMVILGKGWENFENMLRQMALRFPRQVAAFIAFEEPLAHLIYGGSDTFLMPSRFEPCGLGQLIAMHYGSIPIVRKTGGLADTVPQLNADLTEGHGFVFEEYSGGALLRAVKAAAEAFKNKSAWEKAARRISRSDFSWQVSARKYETVYRRVLEKRLA